MNSEDEDFNDIYGNDEEQTTQKGTVVAQESANVEDVEKPKEAEKETASSSLDQLAALQALSSNLTNLANQGSSTESVTPKAVGESNESNSNDDASASVNNQDVSSTNQSTPGMPAGNNLPWDQLRQTMSQFQPPMPQQQQQQQPPQMNNDSQRKVKADLSKDSCKMFIGGLNWETTEDTLRDYFNKYGSVVELKIMKDNNTGRSRGFGFLTFENASSVDEVVKTQHILDGKVIDPKRAIPREEQDKTGKIFVGGIGADVRPKEFEEFFAQYGTIIDAQLMLDKDTGRSRGFGFVTYDSPDAVDRVCQSKYIEFKGKQIEIKRAEPRNNQKASGQTNNMNNMNNGMGNMNMMYQNPMMGGFNPMYNQQAMTDYYQQMQQYYQQMQQQTGVDYSQMFQQQMQMMMPGMNPGAAGADPSKPGQPMGGSPSSNSATPQDNNDVQTLGNEQNKMEDKHGLPKGPRRPSAGSSDYDRYNDNDDYQYRGGNTGRRLNHRIGSNKNNYRGSGRGGRRSHGYHPYNR
ncbi:hypothetical protein TPHA_0P01310 [Tetrapisispora phaffii CBS 4417]|uniref:RRM domain-containing protein n=1 Tax=Tetrapisispora phaffii (strain ATCC 24235 / CBS 4417 / NBRC 1672 / NRRL Y-8282 / UCD 70-5) TaxID=1071381 RepID=G8C2B1_TETPH|nr:hypothetical protein TPHA_0P01310 [Tetrapisispora phaffii CBS 4417]CCE66289.1 hypothetical protein TPHA_0P01310 [Tetrapisispora phaffii CBS 4417]